MKYNTKRKLVVLRRVNDYLLTLNIFPLYIFVITMLFIKAIYLINSNPFDWECDLDKYTNKISNWADNNFYLIHSIFLIMWCYLGYNILY